MAFKYLPFFAALLGLAIPSRALLAGFPFQIQSLDPSIDVNGVDSLNTGNCLTAVSNTDGAAVTLQPCQALGTASQTWTFSAGDNQSGTIKIFGSKCLDVTNGVDASGTKMQIFGCSTNNPNQVFQSKVTTVGLEITTTVLNIQWVGSTRCLDLTGGTQTAGTPIQIWTCQANNTHQMWLQQYAAPTPPSEGAEFQLFSQLQPPHSRVFLVDSTVGNNSALDLFPQDEINIGFNWVFEGGNIKVLNFNICIDVTNGVDADGTPLQVFTCFEGNTNQLWQFNSDYSIQWVGHNKCIDLTNGDVTIDNQLQIWTCGSGNTHQKWAIVPGVVSNNPPD